MTEKNVHRFQAEVTHVLRLVIKSLYRHREVFLRELISNASDALDRLRFRAISEPDLLPAGEELRVRIIPDPDAGTLTIEDNGVGMTAEELEKNLGTVAWSGSAEFLKQLEAAQDSGEQQLQLIGQFGVGFYSAFLVAERVEVVSRAAGTASTYRWESDAEETFTIEEAEEAERGTSVVLHLKPDQREYLDRFRLRQLVSRYSDYIGHRVELLAPPPSAEKDATEDAAAQAGPRFETINTADALWQRPASEVEAKQYEEFYKHLTHDWEPPLAWKHFQIEGTQMFTGLLFLPRQRPFDLFDPTKHYGVRLHVRRVFVMDEAEELVPRWLRFVRGVIDSEDLPLNVSRESLQDSRAAQIIRQQVTSQTLDLLEQLARERTEDYTSLWTAYGPVLKEGLHFEPKHRDRLAQLLRYESSHGEGLTSLSDYVKRMPEGQPAIYYAAGTSRAVLAESPHLEALNRRGYEVLYLTDAIDPFAVDALEKFEDRPLVSAMTADLKLPDAAADSGAEEDQTAPEASRPLFTKFTEVLGDRIEQVRASTRLTDSPACLVIPEGGLQPHIERLMRAQRFDVPVTKRILEINPAHPLIQSLARLHEQDAESPRVAQWMQLVYDQALLAEGSPVEDPSRLARSLSELLTAAASRAADG